MSGIERGRRNLSLLNMARIAGALRVPLTELLQPTVGEYVALHQLVAIEPMQRTADAVEDLAATLRIYRSTRAIVDEWKPGEYLSLC